MQDKCIFCGVTSRSEGFRVVHEDDEIVIFHDRSPASRVHMLAIPKRHIDNVKTLKASDVALIERMKATGRHVLGQQGVEEIDQRLGFHIPPYVHSRFKTLGAIDKPIAVSRFRPNGVNHLHLHLLSLPLPFPGSFKYRPSHASTASSSSSRLSHTASKQGKLKGWSWFVEVDQVLNILRAGQPVRVASVYGRPSTFSTPNGTAAGAFRGAEAPRLL
ncbi:hypothetical protein JCM10908_006269 [Rhodotorula pacifica]|uniref:uncharacterized protein n=1 Tax=Rhodotorula pacifica TaxID=1495444 RepID=UPI00317D0C2E